MYYYLYDSFLQDKKYTKVLGEIEARLIDLSIQGRSSRLNILNDIKELISDAVKQGAETVVVIGDDRTFSKALAAVVNLDVTLGIIPMGNENYFAEYLGIPAGIAACDVLSKRIRERLDISRAGANWFGFFLKSSSANIKLQSADNGYSITPIGPDMEVYVCNFLPPEIVIDNPPPNFFVPHDGILELVVKAQAKSSLFGKFGLKNKGVHEIGQYTIIPFRKIKLLAADPEQDVKLILDGDRVIKPPVEIEVLPAKINLIVGKERRV